MQRLYRNINLMYIASTFGATMVYSSPQLLIPSCSCFFPCPAIHSPKHLFTRYFYLFLFFFLAFHMFCVRYIFQAFIPGCVSLKFHPPRVVRSSFLVVLFLLKTFLLIPNSVHGIFIIL